MARHSSIQRKQIGLNVSLQIVLFFVIFGLANYLGFNYYKRWDFSRDKKYTLSSQSKRVIANLKKPVRFIVFFSGDVEIAKDVNNLLKEYSYASKKSMIDVETVDPFFAMAKAREVVTQYKLGSNENLVILECDGRTKFVAAERMAEYEPSFSLQDKPRLKCFKGEEALTSALIEISEQSSSKIYSLLGHGEAALDKETSLTGLKTFIERQNIKLDTFKFTDVDVVPPDAQALFIIAPKYDFSDREVTALRAYWEKRGHLCVLLNPGSPTPKLIALLAELGITINDDRVLRTVPLPGGVLTGVLKEITGDFVSGSPITKRLANVTARFLGGTTQSLSLDAERVKPNSIQLAALIRASKGFWGETRYENTSAGVSFDPKEDRNTPVVAASAEKGALSNDRVRIDSSRLIVVGNSSFIQNEALTEADLDFVLNGINWLLAREELIGITPKPVRNFSLSLTEGQMGSIALLAMGVIPACVSLVGFIVWLKRRR